MNTSGQALTRVHHIQLVLFIAVLFVSVSVSASGHKDTATLNQTQNESVNLCTEKPILCAKTMTTAVAPNGAIWRVWALEQKIYYQISNDNGVSFGESKKIPISPEKISARNENRPKIGFDNDNGVYLSWARSGTKRFTGDIRFSYSTDAGKNFSTPITINNDNIIAGHSFNEMVVSPSGDVTLVWLDGRFAYHQRKAGKSVNGSELYLAKGNPKKQIGFSNEALARGTCQCCRIAIATDKDDNLSVFWRHIFGDNIREFALITLDGSRPKLSEVNRISYDNWYIEGCPHQGGGISIEPSGRYHLTWYNQGDNGKGIFYAYSDDAGETLSKALPIGNNEKQAAHPHVNHWHDTVDIVWMEFDGKSHQLWHQQSDDRGVTFGPAKIIAQAQQGADRPFIVNQNGKRMVSWQRPLQGHLLQAL